MTVLILMLLALAGPVAIVVWSVRALRWWRGRWRLMAVAPIGVVVAGLGAAALEMRHDPMGHGGWPIWWLLSVVTAALVCYGLSELHRTSPHLAQRDD